MATTRARPALVALAALAAACGDTLVDQHADPGLLAGATCGPALAACNGACVPEDASHCGPTCAVCTAAGPDPNGVPACISQACGFECRPGFLRAGDACERAVAVAAGYVHTCAVAAGEVFCWGNNSTGDVGDGTTTLRASPVKVAGLGDVTAVAAGGGENTGAGVGTYYGHSCAIASGGVIWCWGGNESGQLGDGTNAQQPSPVKVAGLRDPATAVAVGDRHTCAVAAAAVWCWGANGSGQLGDGTTTNRLGPVQAIPSGATAVAAGAEHACAVAGGALACWGDNSSGQSNGGANAPGILAKPNPVALGAITPASTATGGAHSCAAGTGGELACFGANDHSQLGAPPSARGSLTVNVPAVRAPATGLAHTCALLADGGVQYWGANDRGQVGAPSGAGAAISTPTFVSGR